MRVNQEKQHTHKQIDSTGFLNREVAYGITGAEWLTAGVMGVIGAIATATKTIRDRFMDDVKNSPEVKPMIEEHAEALSKNRFKDSGKDFTEFAKDYRRIKRDNAKSIATKIKETWGIGDGILLDTVKRYKVLSDRSRNMIGFSGAVGAVLGAAMTLSFFNGVATRDRIERIEDGVRDLGKGLLDKEGATALANQIIAHQHKVVVPAVTVTKAVHDGVALASQAEVAKS